MSTELPTIDDLRHIADRLRANDIAWARTKWAAGAFGWLTERVPEAEAAHIGSRIDAGDLNALRAALSRADVPGAAELFPGAGGAVGVAGTISSAAQGSGDVLVDVARQGRRSRGWLWLVPLVAITAILAVVLTNLADDAGDTGPGGGDAVVGGTLVETTVPAVPMTAETVPMTAETVPAARSAAPGATAATETTAVAAVPMGIVDAAALKGGFTTLASAIESAGLTETLQGPGPFTVFAPTDDAFAALPEGVLNALLDPANKETLVAVLLHHVLPAKVPAADVTTGDVTTVGGTTLAVSVEGGTVKVGGATVTAADILAGNGVIHQIDTVLVPPTVDLAGLVG